MNMGTVDRVVRVVVGIVLLLIALLIAQDAWQIVLYVISGILVITSIIGFCPLYRIFRFSTKK